MNWDNFITTVESINAAINSFIWGMPAMICIIGVGLFLTNRQTAP